MIQVKTFKFIGSKNNYLGNSKGNKKIATHESNIDLAINDFITDNGYKLISVSVNAITCHEHNNCGYNEVDLLYTILYDNLI